MSFLGDPRYIPTTHRRGYYDQFFGEHLRNAGSVIDFGAGNNDYILTATQNGQRFTRVDFKYFDEPPKLQLEPGDFIAADCREEISSISPESYAVSLTSFVLHHLSAREKIGFINEMNRVTESTGGVGGKILLYPLFRPSRLSRLRGEIGDIGHHRDTRHSIITRGYVVPPKEDDDIATKIYQHETLIIHKTEENKHLIPRLIEDVVRSGSLDPHLKISINIGKLVARLGVSPYKLN